MKNTYFNYKVSILEAILYFFITLIVGQLIAGVITLPTFAIPWTSHFLLPLSFLVGFGASAFIIMLLKKLELNELKHFFHLKVSVLHVILAIAIYLVSLPLAEYLSMLVPTEGNTILEKLYEFFIESFELIFKYKIAAFVMVCILAPILEELIFRGLILRGMLQNGINPWFSIIFTALLFGAAHMNPWQFAGAGFLGAVFGFIYWRTQSLILCIFLHFLNNLIAYIITIHTQSMEETVFEPDFIILGSSVVLTLILGYFFYNNSKPTALEEVQNEQSIEWENVITDKDE